MKYIRNFFLLSCFVFMAFVSVPKVYAMVAGDIIKSVFVFNLSSQKTEILEFNKETLYIDATDSYIRRSGNYLPIKYGDTQGDYQVRVVLDSNKLQDIPGGGSDISEIKIKKNVQYCGQFEILASLANGFLPNDVFNFPSDKGCKDRLFYKGEPLEISLEITNRSGQKIFLDKSLYKFTIGEKPLDSSCKLEITANGQQNQYFYNDQKIKISGTGIDSGGKGFRVYINNKAQLLTGCAAKTEGPRCNVEIALPDDDKLLGYVHEFSLVDYFSVGEYKIEVKQVETNRTLCSKILPVNRAGTTPKPVSNITLIPTSVDEPGKSASSLQIEISSPGELCDSVPDNVNGKSVDYKTRCQRCSAEKGIWTALGCFPTNVTDLAKTVFNLFSGLLGLFIFYCIISNGFKVMISRDSADAMKKAQEAITSCIVGLLVLVFSVLFLRIVGVDILKLPGWS